MVKRPEHISWESCFRNDPVPDLLLPRNLALPLRVYVLKCADDCWYVGLSPKHKVQDRISEQFKADVSKGSSHYCQAHAPISVACVWPVAAHAMEAAFFYAMQEALCITDFRRLGGWVYTSSKPSPLDVMRLTQTKRQLSNKCFDCGGSGHYANSALCPGSNLDCYYKCLQCKAWNNVSSRGQSTLQSCAANRRDLARRGAAAPPSVSPSGPPSSPPASSPRASVSPSGPRSSPPASSPRALVSPSGPPASNPPVLKRPAGQAFKRNAPALSLDGCWERCRKKGRYGAVRDVLRDMDTVQAGKSIRHIDENAPRWRTRFHWKAGEYKKGIAEFSAHQEGGSPGVGCTRQAMEDVYRHHAR
jgi:predicted GIY-YIG superfamily endonuclease